jgi:integrase
LPVADVNRSLVLDVLRPLWDTRKVTTGKRLRGWIENIIAYAVAKEYRPDGVNPAVWRHGLQPLLAKPSKVRRVVHHAAMRYSQVPAFMAELAKDPSTAARALAFTILTGLRSAPVRYAVWGEIDWDAEGGPVWCIPWKKMKTKEDFECPLSDAAVAILKAVKGDHEPDANAVIFTGRFGDRLAEGGLRCALRRVCKAMGVKAPTVHGFRSSFRDFAGDKTNHHRDVAEAALAHTVGGTEGAYRRETALEKRRKLMQRWADYLSPKGGNIIPLKRSA